MGDLEAALSATEADADASLRAAAAVVRELKKAKSAAVVGSVRELRKAAEAAEQLAAQLVSSTRALRSGWTIDEQKYLASGDYTRELLAQAARENVTMVEQDDRLLCYPSVVRVYSGDQAIDIDKKKHRTLRPSVVVQLLRDEQTRPPKFKPEAFLESLARAYDFVIASEGRPFNATVRLVDVYDVLTLMPGQSKEYTRQEFARDLYLLDQSGVSRTKNARELSLPASTLTKGQSGVLTTVSKNGQQKIYAGIRFA